MIAILTMAWRYLAYHRIKTTILVVSITLIIYLPVGLRVVVERSAESLTKRAEATPLLVGAKGSPLELALNSLYFRSDTPADFKFSEVGRLADFDLALAIPLHIRFRAVDQPIVGTTLDYFDFRGLEITRGRMMTTLGECVVGAKAAAALQVEPGGSVLSSPESVFDLAGSYPLKIKVAGVLAPTDGPDDEAVFVDLKTSWVMAGLAHGHQDLANPDAASGVLKREGNVIVANASVMQYNEITPDNVDSFHFHGSSDNFPVTAMVVVPHDVKSAALLRGQYLSDDERVQIVEPETVMGELLTTILTVQKYVLVAVVIVGASTVATAILVLMLSLRLRRREIETMHRIGGRRETVWAILASEIVFVLLAGGGAAGLLTVATHKFGPVLIRALFL
jgi:putative ABC transport system permease protein